MPQYVEVKGQVIEFPDGMSTGDIEAAVKQNMLSIKPATSVQAGKDLNSIPRQIGLTARYGLEGVANAAQLVTEPLRYVTDRLTGSTGKTKPLGALATDAADWMGLPTPQGADERVIGDAARLVAGTAGTMGAGALAQRGGKVAQEVGRFFTQNPVSQLSSAAGAGLAGGASREAGESTGGQVLSSVLGGVAGNAAVGLGSMAKTQVIGLKNKYVTAMTPQEMDVKIGEVLRKTGVDYSQVPERLRQSLRQELAASLRTEKDLDPQAVSRLLDFRKAGVTPTRGMLTLDPVQITREQNLAKMGANSMDGELQGLARIQNQNNAKLISNLNDLGASRGDALQAGEFVSGAVRGTQAGLRRAEQAAWDAAKGSAGYRAPISSRAISDINQALGDEGLMPFMNPTISRYMEAFQTGQPFTPQAYRNLQSMLSREVAKGGNEGAAAGLARRILEQSELTPAGVVNAGNLPATQGMASSMRMADGAANEAIDAVNAARRATRTAYAFEDSNPLVRSVLSDGASGDPQRIAQRFILGGTANEAADLVNQVGPRGLTAVKEAIVADLKSKALSGAADEVGKFSQSAFNKALNSIGERKLSILFTPEELQALRTNARVASLMQAQPVGSAVNNSNSGALLLGRGLDFLTNSQVPFLSNAVTGARLTVGNRQAQNLTPALIAEQQRRQFGGGLLGPAVALGGVGAASMGGLLAAP